MANQRERRINMSRIKKSLAEMLVFAIILCNCTINAKAETVNVSAPWYPREFAAGEGWGRNEVYLMDGSHQTNEDYMPVYIVKSTGHATYCIEPGVPFGGDSPRESHGPDYWQNYSNPGNETLGSDGIQELLSELMSQAYQGYFTANAHGEIADGQETNLAKWRAAQFLVWEVIVGERDIDFNHVDPPAGKNKVADMLRSNFPQAATFWAEYNRIVDVMQMQYKTPSFVSKTKNNAPAVTLTWDGTQYKAVLTDTNGVLSGFDFTATPESVTLTKSGNDLIITSDKPVDDVTIHGVHQSTSCAGLVVWTSGDGNQKLLSAELTDPFDGYAKAGTPNGTIEINKRTTSGMTKECWSFDIEPEDSSTFADGSSKITVTTDADGKATATVPAGHSYKVTEVGHDSITTGYSVLGSPASQVNVTADKTATVIITNTAWTGDVVVSKTSENGLLEGFEFSLEGTSDIGTSVSFTAITGPDGKATFKDVPAGTYTVSELNVADFYIAPTDQSVTVIKDQTSNLSFENLLKKATVTVTKSSENGEIEGISFTITGTSTAGTSVSLTATTNALGVATFENVPLGTYTLAETNVRNYFIAPNDAQITVTESGASADVENLLKKGSLEITKAAENGQIEGIAFKVSGTSDAGTTVNVTAVTNAQGKAVFNDLPVGTYTVSETGSPDYFVLPADQTVVITYQGTAKLNFENLLKKGSVKVTKTSENGEVEGVEFTLEGTSDAGTTVSMTAVTDKDGIASFADVPVGKYTVSETNVKAYFIVPASQNVTVEYEKTAELSFENKLRKGSVDVMKTAEAAEKSGFKFTLEGTSDAGTNVSMTATTNADGVATFNNVPLGTYTVKEIETPNRFVVPADQKVSVTSESVPGTAAFKNIEKRGDLSFEKIDGFTGEALSGIAFKITNTATGEWHIVVTDASGKVNTKNLVNSGNTNASDAAIVAEGIDETKLDPAAGVWFMGGASAVYDDRGAFPVGKYTAEELATASSGPYKLIRFEFEITENGAVVDAGTQKNYEPEEIETELLDGIRKDHYTFPMGNVTLYDTIIAHNLIPGKEYIVNGSLVYKADGSPVVDEEGKQITGTYTFTATGRDMTLEDAVEFAVPDGILDELEDIVAFETLTDAEDNIWAKHEDLEDKKQTVSTTTIGEFYKYDPATGESIEGAVFRVTDKTDDHFVEVTTDADGYAFFAAIPGHEYEIVEIEAPDNYILNEQVFTVSIPEDAADERIFLSVLDIRQGTAVLRKLDSRTGKPVAGAELTVYRKEQGEYRELFRQVTDAYGRIYFCPGEMTGSFFYRETAAPAGYYLDDEYYSFTVREDGTVSGTTEFREAPYGTVILKKYSVSGAKLEGARFAVYSKDGTLLLEDVTDAYGRIYFDTPAAGEYYFVELEAPRGYLRDGSPRYFTIDENYVISGTTVLTNEPDPTPNTGERLPSRTLLLTGAVAAAVAVGSAACGREPRRKKEEE